VTRRRKRGERERREGSHHVFLLWSGPEIELSSVVVAAVVGAAAAGGFARANKYCDREELMGAARERGRNNKRSGGGREKDGEREREREDTR